MYKKSKLKGTKHCQATEMIRTPCGWRLLLSLEIAYLKCLHDKEHHGKSLKALKAYMFFCSDFWKGETHHLDHLY